MMNRLLSKADFFNSFFPISLCIIVLQDGFCLISIDMPLPTDLESSFWAELQELEEVKRMRYITSVERIGMVKGQQQGLQQGSLRLLLRLLEHSFGAISEEFQ